MYHSFLCQSFTDGHVGCFQHLAIVNCADMNIGVRRFFWIGVSEFLGYNPSSGIDTSTNAVGRSGQLHAKKKMKFDHQLIPHTKINSRWIKVLKYKSRYHKSCRKISDIPCNNIFTNMSLRTRDIKEKNKWDFINLKSFCTAKENINKMKREPTVWEIYICRWSLGQGFYLQNI